MHRPSILSLAVICSLQSATPRAQTATFRVDTRLVVLYATVRNDKGEAVTELDQGAFTVYEDGRQQPITVFRKDDVPASLGLLLDNSGSMRPLRAKVEAAALALVRASNPLDETFIISFADKVQVDVPFTNDVHELEAGISRVDSIGGTAMRDAVDRGQSYLAEHAARDPKVMVVVTDGNDNASITTIGQIERQAAAHDTVIYAVGLFDAGDPSRHRHGRSELEALTEKTGGVAYFPERVEDIGAVMLDIAHQIRSQYTIAYAPQNQTLDGSFRRIRVTARPAHLVVRTRPGYLALPR
jgi:Ca-activated chloride channel family protein